MRGVKLLREQQPFVIMLLVSADGDGNLGYFG